MDTVQPPPPNGLTVQLVYDGGQTMTVPAEMGAPNDGQLLGTVRDRVTELAGRVCYDSLGALGSRPSGPYHDHLRKDKHWSVMMHCPVVVELRTPPRVGTLAVMLLLANRPGVSFRFRNGDGVVRVLVNPAAVLQWDAFTPDYVGEVADGHALNLSIGRVLHEAMRRQCYEYVLPPMSVENVSGPTVTHGTVSGRVVEPAYDDEKWVTVYMRGSRGFSHEQVRHHYRAAVSQRSTRYVDESNAVNVVHPLERAFLADPDVSSLSKEVLTGGRSDTELACRNAYRWRVIYLEEWLAKRGADKRTARKQARGAARLMLGNGIPTELIFSASLPQWKFMLEQRACAAADAEIREVYAGRADDSSDEVRSVLDALLASRHAPYFEDWRVGPSPDGIGLVAHEV